MTGVVVIPWMDDPARRPLLEWVMDAYRGAGWLPVLGEQTRGPWSKAVAVEAGLRRIETEFGELPEVVAIVDADVWAPGLGRAFAEVEARHRIWAMPHLSVYRLSEAATAEALERSPREVVRRLRTCQLDRPPYRGVDAGGALVIRSDAYRRAPFHPRFVGWGHEDMSAGLTWGTLYGSPRRFEEPLIHLWHPPQPKITPGVGSRDSKLLYDRIRAASGRQDRMLELTEEARSWLADAERTQTVIRSDSTPAKGEQSS